jgi:catechol 2,3-dioxygenase-like lactoylglutathione lyase family enzyme
MESAIERAVPVNRNVGLVAVVVRDYDEAIRFYLEKLDFELVEDTPLSETKRWVVVKPRGDGVCNILLAKAANDTQFSAVGNQTGGRVFLFLNTDDFARDYELFRANGVEFVREPVKESYGMVAVFKDLYGNMWDLIELTRS